MKTSDPRLREVWMQREIVVILRRAGKGEKLRLRLRGELAYRIEAEVWLRNSRQAIPRWSKQGQYWEIPKAWFNDFVNRTLECFGKIYIIQPYRETEVCARACMEAQGHECQCTCMGANHGAGVNSSWFEVSETFAVKSSAPMLACRLLTRK